ncbi:hypothetical protein IWW55_001724 [Coemansia sp. RSA 2706]|nr:hypothetical protein IWW55_001724 [Coemansia sp. RSA 2706]KAJ2370488.1 hypothetical protein H4S01_000345 [Coemansia sp. RSA 2610]KAJ2388521.1 hypothetical protein H4S02_002827 [Coemansia sp. RSA 2611]KAJ2737459.1 hypothetical protein H4R23_001830 [Coemansia sp. Cherry 401B]
MLDPRLIRSIKLFTDDIDFDWRFFQLGKSSKVVVFESLESVNASCNAYERPRQALYDGQHVKLKFPALRSLDISEFIIEPPLVKCLQASPLESLSYTHGCAYSIKNLIPLIAKLKRLKLSLEFNVGSSSGDDYIRTLNDVFQQTQDLEIAVCTVWDDSKLVNFRIVDWPFLTHLWIQAVFEFDDFLVALPKMTSLVNLSILIAGFNEGYSARAVAALKKHKRGYPDRFASKVEKLRLEHEIELSGFEMDELPLRPFYKKNLKLIKWYMPNVKWVAIVPM